MSPDPTAAVLIIGQEILSGKVVDSNGPFLLSGLRERGVEVVELRQVGDDIGAIADALGTLRGRAERVLTTGGIGPTHDDVTVEAVARHLRAPLVPDRALTSMWRRAVAGRVTGRAAAPVQIPAGARVHAPQPGQASFVPVLEADGIFVLPGIPALMRASFAGLDVWGRGRPFIAEVLAFDVDEEELAGPLAALQAAWPQVQVGSYPQPPTAACRVRVTLDGRDPAAVAGCLADARRRLPAALPAGPPA